jgi:hypothetical protein
MKLKPTFETETYINEQGYFAIHQTAGSGEEDIIWLSPEQLRAVIAEARVLLRTQKTWWSQEERD